MSRVDLKIARLGNLTNLIAYVGTLSQWMLSWLQVKLQGIHITEAVRRPSGLPLLILTNDIPPQVTSQ